MSVQWMAIHALCCHPTLKLLCRVIFGVGPCLVILAFADTAANGWDFVLTCT